MDHTELLLINSKYEHSSIIRIKDYSDRMSPSVLLPNVDKTFCFPNVFIYTEGICSNSLIYAGQKSLTGIPRLNEPHFFGKHVVFTWKESAAWQPTDSGNGGGGRVKGTVKSGAKMFAIKVF